MVLRTEMKYFHFYLLPCMREHFYFHWFGVVMLTFPQMIHTCRINCQIAHRFFS